MTLQLINKKETGNKNSSYYLEEQYLYVPLTLQTFIFVTHDRCGKNSKFHRLNNYDLQHIFSYIKKIIHYSILCQLSDFRIKCYSSIGFILDSWRIVFTCTTYDFLIEFIDIENNNIIPIQIETTATPNTTLLRYYTNNKYNILETYKNSMTNKKLCWMNKKNLVIDDICSNTHDMQKNLRKVCEQIYNPVFKMIYKLVKNTMDIKHNCQNMPYKCGIFCDCKKINFYSLVDLKKLVIDCVNYESVKF